jgi:acyl-CoA thioester hydrolase
VRITDVNYGQHVGNDTMLAFIQEARVQWLRSLGYPSELLAAPVGLILVDLAVRMKAEAAYGDRLVVQLAVAEWSKVGFEAGVSADQGGGRGGGGPRHHRFCFLRLHGPQAGPAARGFPRQAGG